MSRVSTAARNLELRWNQGEDVYLTLPHNLRFKKLLTEETSREESIAESPNNIEIDVFEAAEITAPELTSKSVVAKKIVVFKETMKDLLQNPNFENLQDTVADLLKKGAQKKEESLDQMRKLEKRKRRSPLYEESTHVLLANIFISIHELLEADKNMRIGKGFCSEDTKKYSVESDSCGSSESHFASVFCEKVTDGFYAYNTSSQIWFPLWYIQWFKRFLEFIRWPSNSADVSNINQVRNRKVQVTENSKNIDSTDSDPWTVYIVKSGYRIALMILKFLQPEKV